MSKRLQIIFSDDEVRQLTRLARRRKLPVSRIVRDSVRLYALTEPKKQLSEERINAVLRYTELNGPSADMETLLAEIEKGRFE